MSPTSESRLSQSPHRQIPAGFLAWKKDNSRPISQLSQRELHDLWNKNKRILADPAPSTSTYYTRITAEQAAIEAALGMAKLENGLNQTHISQDETMNVVSSTSSPSRTVEAKRRAIGRYHADTPQRGTTVAMGLDEAMELERKAHVAALETQRHELEQEGLPLRNEMLTQAQREARIWEYMNTKRTESDEEDEEDEEEDSSTWFEDEDGSNGQPFVDLDDIIRVDEGRWGEYQ